MKPFCLLLSCVALAAFLSCQRIDDPQGAAQPAPTTQDASVQVPEPVLVPFSDLPHPFSEATYRLSGWPLSEGPVPLLEILVHAGFTVEMAWYPKIALCGAAFLDEIIVELDAPNDAILRMGFNRDFSGTSGPCTSHWDEYRFTD